MVAIGYPRSGRAEASDGPLRRLLNRARPTQTEVDVLRGMLAAIIESRSERAGRKNG